MTFTEWLHGHALVSPKVDSYTQAAKHAMLAHPEVLDGIENEPGLRRALASLGEVPGPGGRMVALTDPTRQGRDPARWLWGMYRAARKRRERRKIGRAHV